MDYKELLGLIEAVDKSNLSRFTYKEGSIEIELEKQWENKKNEAAQTENETSIDREKNEIINEKVDCDKFEYIKSPLVGTFYAKPCPDEEKFVSVGDKISKDQVIGIIEVMKMMNEVKSEFEGIVEEILIEDNETVDYGQSLIKIRIV